MLHLAYFTLLPVWLSLCLCFKQSHSITSGTLQGTLIYQSLVSATAKVGQISHLLFSFGFDKESRGNFGNFQKLCRLFCVRLSFSFLFFFHPFPSFQREPAAFLRETCCAEIELERSLRVSELYCDHGLSLHT